MQQTIDMLESLFKVSAENRVLEAAIVTAQQILQSPSEGQLSEAIDEIHSRLKRCGRPQDHTARHLIRSLATTELLKRELNRCF